MTCYRMMFEDHHLIGVKGRTVAAAFRFGDFPFKAGDTIEAVKGRHSKLKISPIPIRCTKVTQVTWGQITHEQFTKAGITAQFIENRYGFMLEKNLPLAFIEFEVIQ